MNDALLVGVLNGVADLDEQLQPLLQREPAVITELDQRNAMNQFHHEVWPA